MLITSNTSHHRLFALPHFYYNPTINEFHIKLVKLLILIKINISFFLQHRQEILTTLYETQIKVQIGK